MALLPKRPLQKRIGGPKKVPSHWQDHILLGNEILDLLPIFQLPRPIVMDILINWITLDTLCVFDTAICEKDSRKLLLQDFFLDNNFIFNVNSIGNEQHEKNCTWRRNATLLAKWLYYRQIYVRVLDFSGWFFSNVELYLAYLWQDEVENERYKNLEALTLPKESLSFELCNCVGSKLKYVTYLNLSGCTVTLTDDVFKNLIFTCRHLQYLNISNCYQLSSKSMSFMARRCENLLKFIWSGHNCHDYEFIKTISRCCKNLQYLDLRSGCCPRFDERAFSYLGPGACFQRLKWINLSGCCRLREDVLERLVKYIETLEYFSMCVQSTDMVLGDGIPLITDECIIALSRSNQDLKELHLRGCVFITNACLSELSKNCKELRHLDLIGTRCSMDALSLFQYHLTLIIELTDNEGNNYRIKMKT